MEGIRKVFIREAKRTTVDAGGSGSYRTENEWMLDTEGVNLLSVMCHPDVDYTRTVSNHLIEIIDVLGIEAGRNALMKVRAWCDRHGKMPHANKSLAEQPYLCCTAGNSWCH